MRGWLDCCPALLANAKVGVAAEAYLEPFLLRLQLLASSFWHSSLMRGLGTWGRVAPIEDIGSSPQ